MIEPICPPIHRCQKAGCPHHRKRRTWRPRGTRRSLSQHAAPSSSLFEKKPNRFASTRPLPGYHSRSRGSDSGGHALTDVTLLQSAAVDDHSTACVDRRCLANNSFRGSQPITGEAQDGCAVRIRRCAATLRRPTPHLALASTKDD